MCKNIFIVLAATLLTAHSVLAKDFYRLLGSAPMGSNFRPVEAQSPFPFNKEFSQFTDHQQQLFRSAYEYADDETPPFPKGGTHKIYKPLIKGHDRVARGGWLSVLATIDENGKVEKVAIYESPSEAMTELALSVMYYTKFIPGTCAGEPCKMDYPFEFEMRDRSKEMNSINAEDFANGLPKPSR